MSRPLRLGVVPYLNVEPIAAGLRGDPRFELVRAVPARIAELLHAGDLDLGTIPTIEYVRGDYALVPGMAIGSDGPILSVAIFTTTPMAQVRRLALDTSSRTSVALTHVLCAKQWQIAPEMVSAAPDLDRMLAVADAALIIGDPALDIDPLPAGVEKVDLGEAWQTLTGLPFVYAAWAGRPGALTPPHVAALAAARDRGLDAVDQLAAEAAHGDATRAAVLASYLRHNLRYAFGPREQAGLARFFALAAEVGHISRALPLRFY